MIRCSRRLHGAKFMLHTELAERLLLGSKMLTIWGTHKYAKADSRKHQDCWSSSSNLVVPVGFRK